MSYPQTAIGTRIVVDWETSQGVPKVASQKGRKIACTETLAKTKTLDDVDEVRSDPNPQDPTPGPTDLAGDINLAPNLTNLPFFLAFHTNNMPTPSGGGPYLYDGAYLSGALKTIMMEKGYLELGAGAQYEQLTGIANKSLSADFGASGLLKFRLGCQGMNASALSGTPYDAAVDDWETGSKLHHAMIAASGAKIGGAPVDYVLTGSFNNERNIVLEDRPVGAAGVLASLPGGKIMCSGTMKCRFASTAVLSMIQSGDPTSLELIWTIPGGLGYYLSLKWGRIFPEYTSPKKSQDGLLELSFNWKAAFDSGDASAFRWKVSNDKAAAEYA